MNKLKALIVGATGATGRELVKLLLENENFESVTIFVRTIPDISHPKLIIHKIDFSRLHEYEHLIIGDVLFSALGTTLKDAGSKELQYIIDFDYQYEFAKFAAKNKVSFYSLVSSAGANYKSLFFYPKIKGELEEAIKKLCFKKIQIFQPSFLVRQEDVIRTGEKIGIFFFSILNRIGLLKSLRPISVKYLAQKMISMIFDENEEKIRVLKLKDIVKK